MERVHPPLANSRREVMDLVLALLCPPYHLQIRKEL